MREGVPLGDDETFGLLLRLIDAMDSDDIAPLEGYAFFLHLKYLNTLIIFNHHS